MKKLINLISEEVTKAFVSAGYDEKYGKVTLSNRPDLCEFQCNGAMAAAKEYKCAPFMISDKIAQALAENELFESVESVKPGFINMKVSPAYLAKYVSDMKADEGRFGCDKAAHPKTIIVDYGGANVAKPLHVGHLRSAVIGESIKRIGKFMGHNVIGDVHLGDWGLQMERKLLTVDAETQACSEPGIFAIGDICHYSGKRKLLLCGFHEATMAAFAISAWLRPDQRQLLQYTTTSPRLHELLGVASAVRQS